ncbi:hypothetical protein PV04_03755 [Phialophora macrospora]|uniref:Bacteriophage T5 Orf172 DNA-binding domain-containing protein n=1 Tax=Phialophora macrospora TaxID=1851006 RepID=A0A0D2EBF3_9EURO|nr:hypothetical protein PV04_03755 [Phialophora macrospora]
MASGILTPRSRRPAFQQGPAFSAIHTLTSHVDHYDASYTPPLATPELEWAETPPATEDPRTPGHDSELNDGVLLPHSPLAIRNTHLERHDVSVLDLSHFDSDVPKQLLSKLSSETSPTRRLFQNELLAVSVTASSRSHPSPSNDNPCAVPDSVLNAKVEQEPSSSTPVQPRPSSNQPSDGTVGTHFVAGRVPAAAGSVKTEGGLAISEGVIAILSQNEISATTSTTAPPPCSTKKQPLTLSVAWALNTNLSTILPFEAVERFQEDCRRCIATTKAGSRCKLSTARTSKANFATELSGALSLLQCSFDFAAFAKHMAPFIESVTYTQAHMKPSRACLDELCSYSGKPREIVTANTHQAKAIANSVEAVFTLWISALMKVPPETKVASPPTKGNTEGVRGALFSTFDFSRIAAEEDHVPYLLDRPTTTATSRAGSSHVADTSDTVSPATGQVMTRPKPARLSTHLNHRFVKYVYSGKDKDATAQQLIRQTLLKPLTSADMHRVGYIYTYWQPPNMGYVKIGYSKDVKKRLADWRRQCGFNLEEHNSGEIRTTARVSHLHRIESLIHAELKDYRLLEPSCTGCGKSHREWFEVRPNHALRVVAKWTNRSFYSGGLLDNSLHEEDIEKLCELIEAEPILPLPPAKQTTKTKVKASRWSSGGGRHDLKERR